MTQRSAETSGDSARPVRLAYVTAIPLTQWAFLRGQNAYMRERGFELHAICSPGPLLRRLEERDGVIPHPLPIRREISPLADVVSIVRLYRLLRRIRPDVAHVSTPKAALLGSIAAWLARVPVRVLLVRGTATEGAHGSTRALFRLAERLTARLCTHALCVAPSLLRFLREEAILGPGEGCVLANGMSNGIDVERFQPAPAPVPDGDPESGPTIGFVGRLARDKGIEEISAAWEVLREEFPSARLLLVGPWEERDAVAEEHRRRLERDPRVEVIGSFVDDVLPFYRRMSIFAFPSHGTEGFPNAPMEAAAVGLPVIATTVVGCVDAVEPGVTGMLVPPRDVAALENALRRYLSDPELRARHGAAGRRRVAACFRTELIWEALYAAYVGFLNERGLGPRLSLPSSSGSTKPGAQVIANS